MHLQCRIHWTSQEHLKRMMDHLSSYQIVDDQAIRNVLPEGGPTIKNRIQFSVELGTYQSHSIFIFFKGSGITSEIVGNCPTGKIQDIWDDFEYLKQQMSEIGAKYSIKDVHIRFNGEKLYIKTFSSYVFKRTILKDLIVLPGGLAIISGSLGRGEFKMDIIALIAGFILWCVTTSIGYMTEGEYVLK